jgi:hypothetical protein
VEIVSVPACRTRFRLDELADQIQQANYGQKLLLLERYPDYLFYFIDTRLELSKVRIVFTDLLQQRAKQVVVTQLSVLRKQQSAVDLL